MAGIRMDNCIGGKIINCSFDNCNVAIEASNSRDIQVSGTRINNCDKGVKLDNCWDSEVTGTIVNDSRNNPRSSGRFRLSLLSALINHYLYK